MPLKPKTPCCYPNCPALTDDRYCPQHERDRKRQADARRKDDPLRRLYGTARWKRLRSQVLREEPLCRDCRAEGHVEASAEVDHIVPARRGGGFFDRANLQGLCHPHHSRKTASEDGGFGNDAPRPESRAPSGLLQKG